MKIALLAFSSAVFLAQAATPCLGDQPEAISAWLARKIIADGQTQAETADYCASRFPKMPTVTTAAEWEAYAKTSREKVFNQVIFRGEAAGWRTSKTRIEWLDTISGGTGYRIKKLRYEAVPGLWIPAVLYEPTAFPGKVPVVLNVNGHDRNGKAAAYKQMRCIDQAKRGMLALDVEWLGMGQLAGPEYDHARIVEIDLCGTSGIALHYLAMSRGIDLLLAHEHADPARVAVTGLSGGGWQTIFFSSLDTRVTLCNPVAGYSSFLTRVGFASDLGDFEQTPCDLATVADYTHLTALMAPRPTLLTFNANDDCCFRADHALQPLLDAAAPIFALYNKQDRLRSYIGHDPGTHNYERNNREALYQMLGESFFAGSAFDPKEIAREGEIQTRGEFEVSLPADNATIHSLALGLAKNLPRELAGDPATRKAKLESIVGKQELTVTADQIGQEEKAGVRATFWRVKVGAWSVPVVEIAPTEASETVVVVADLGKAHAGALVAKLIGEKKRVVALDPFYTGEAQLKDHAYLYALLLTTVGDRPLGVQAGEIAAVARWASGRSGGKPVTIDSIGPRSSVMALVAAALDPATVRELWLHKPLESLKGILESNAKYADSPELFCFGLLESFEVGTLIKLVEEGGAKVHKVVE